MQRVMSWLIFLLIFIQGGLSANYAPGDVLQFSLSGKAVNACDIGIVVIAKNSDEGRETSYPIMGRDNQIHLAIGNDVSIHFNSHEIRIISKSDVRKISFHQSWSANSFEVRFIALSVVASSSFTEKRSHLANQVSQSVMDQLSLANKRVVICWPDKGNEKLRLGNKSMATQANSARAARPIIGGNNLTLCEARQVERLVASMVALSLAEQQLALAKKEANVLPGTNRTGEVFKWTNKPTPLGYVRSHLVKCTWETRDIFNKLMSQQIGTYEEYKHQWYERGNSASNESVHMKEMENRFFADLDERYEIKKRVKLLVAHARRAKARELPFGYAWKKSSLDKSNAQKDPAERSGRSASPDYYGWALVASAYQVASLDSDLTSIKKKKAANHNSSRVTKIIMKEHRQIEVLIDHELIRLTRAKCRRPSNCLIVSVRRLISLRMWCISKNINIPYCRSIQKYVSIFESGDARYVGRRFIQRNTNEPPPPLYKKLHQSWQQKYEQWFEPEPLLQWEAGDVWEWDDFVMERLASHMT